MNEENRSNSWEMKCLRCKHQWIKRIAGSPQVCPKCGSRLWNTAEGKEEMNTVEVLKELAEAAKRIVQQDEEKEKASVTKAV